MQDYIKTKMSRKRLAYVSSENDSTCDEDADYVPQKRMKQNSRTRTDSKSSLLSENNYMYDAEPGERKPTRVPKCFSRNALMARENRIKKKMHLENLENEVGKVKQENKNLKSIVNNQSFVIKDLRKEVKYLKSVLANSTEISSLLKAINRNTGMSNTAALNSHLLSESVCFNRNDFSKNEMLCGGKTAHPWEHSHQRTNYPSFPTPESMDELNLGTDFDFTNNLTKLNGIDAFTEETFSLFGGNNDILSDLSLVDPSSYDLLKDMNSESTVDMNVHFDKNVHVDKNVHLKSDERLVLEESSQMKCKNTFDEHNYNAKCNVDSDSENDDVGICLHVSKKRVSLEFCSTCSENSSTSTSKDNPLD